MKHAETYVSPDGVHTNGCENVWSLFKRGIMGVFHKVSAKYLPLYTDQGNLPPINIPEPPPGSPNTYDGLLENNYFNLNDKGEKIYAKANSGHFKVPDPDPNEEYEYVRAQLFGPEYRCKNPPHGAQATMGGFLQDYAKLGHFWQKLEDLFYHPDSIMECYTPQQLPVINTLAAEFAVSDAWFCSVPTQTNANRAFLGAGTSGGKVDNKELPHVDAPTTIWNVLSARIFNLMFDIPTFQRP